MTDARARARDRRDRGVPRRRQVLARALPGAARAAEHDAGDVRAARCAHELLLAPLQEPLAAANIVAALVERALPGAARAAARGRRRRRSTPSRSPKEVKVDDAAVKAFYDQNQAAFQTPEQARIEYVLLTLPALAAQVTVDAGGSAQAVRREHRELHEGRGALRVAHPGGGQAGREATPTRPRRRRRPTSSPRRCAREPGEVRRAREGEFRGPGLGRRRAATSARSRAARW